MEFLPYFRNEGSLATLSVTPIKTHFTCLHAFPIYSILEKNPYNKVAYRLFTGYCAAMSLAHSGQCSSRFGNDQHRHHSLFSLFPTPFFQPVQTGLYQWPIGILSFCCVREFICLATGYPSALPLAW